MRGGDPGRGPGGSGSSAWARFRPGLPRAGPVGPRSWAATVFDPGGRHTSIPRGDPTGASGPGRGSFFCLPAAALGPGRVGFFCLSAAALGPGRVRFLLSSSSGAEPWVLSFVFQLWRWAPGGGRGDFLFRPEFTSGRGQRPREGRQSFYSVDFFPLIFYPLIFYPLIFLSIDFSVPFHGMFFSASVPFQRSFRSVKRTIPASVSFQRFFRSIKRFLPASVSFRQAFLSR